MDANSKYLILSKEELKVGEKRYGATWVGWLGMERMARYVLFDKRDKCLKHLRKISILSEIYLKTELHGYNDCIQSCKSLIAALESRESFTEFEKDNLIRILYSQLFEDYLGHNNLDQIVTENLRKSGLSRYDKHQIFKVRKHIETLANIVMKHLVVLEMSDGGITASASDCRILKWYEHGVTTKAIHRIYDVEALIYANTLPIYKKEENKNEQEG